MGCAQRRRRSRPAALADLWQRPDQQAAAALAKGDAKQAASVARSPDWRGGAAYRDGDYDSAATDFAKAAGADGAYNKGNALAKLGRYDDALAAYDEALKLAPDMADAKANKQAVEEFQKQNKNAQSKDGGKNSPKKDSKDKDQQQKSDQDSQKQDSKDENKQQNSSGEQNDQQQGQQGQPQDQQDSAQSGEQKDQQGKPNEQQHDDGKQQSATGAGGEKQDKAQDAQQQVDAQQQKALSKEIDKALAGRPQPADKNAKPQAGIAEEDDATREKKQALEHWLQRVPDDPGGLLRRKFQLEYQRRQQHAGEEP